MPVKKGAQSKDENKKRKSAPKKKKGAQRKPVPKKKVSSQDRKTIQDAATAIPDLIAQQLKTQYGAPEEKAGIANTQAHAYPTGEARAHIRKKKSLLWFGVTTLMLSTLLLWIMSMQAFVKEVDLSSPKTPGLVSQVKKEYSNIFTVLDDTDQTHTDTTAVKKSVKDQIASFFKRQKEASPSTQTTVFIATSTDALATDTPASTGTLETESENNE
ncbi:MAG: hypothetical protein COU35_00290 [Candidatus Magasanikbacteria bacterium CG10_big_fil_rev_8_21_14_0_10_47_10]|uniref:Uncharacterized protein n=1 Tax=Candidatus Magasanikbacteria bacterium CG10_big_fil_rev_8_21_14_0_10_47_10 TaxID=1974652 RepID=A0A2H0TRN0_9BACT|nr:MAG: hypothetical protein COU35_00290 [Candidatus Magasanikbacteria bacterium CG10_big_fil_rev_8_21_14_0_10_47_10]